MTATQDWAAHELRQQTAAMPDVQTMTSRSMCRCGARDGWARLENPWDDDLWVCIRCGGPSYMAEEKRMGLAFFRGGPLDGRAYEVSSLTDPQLAAFLPQYNWTPEVVTSEATQRTARVWVHKETPGEIDRQAEAAAELPPDPPEPSTVEGQEGSDSMAEGTSGGRRQATVDTSGLREGREALNASRTDIEKHSGLTVPMIARIEKGGPSTTQEQVDKYKAALNKIKQDGAKPAASKRASKTAASKTAASSDAKEGGDTKGSQTPPPSSAAPEAKEEPQAPPAATEAQQSDTGGVVRLHEWKDFTFTPRGQGDMTGGSPIKWSKSTSAAFTFVAFTRNEQGKEVVELWETRRRRVRYADPKDVSAPKTRRRRSA